MKGYKSVHNFPALSGQRDTRSEKSQLGSLSERSCAWSVNIGKISVVFTGCEKIDVYNFAILLQIVQMPLSPNAYLLLFFGG